MDYVSDWKYYKKTSLEFYFGTLNFSLSILLITQLNNPLNTKTLKNMFFTSHFKSPQQLDLDLNHLFRKIQFSSTLETLSICHQEKLV